MKKVYFILIFIFMLSPLFAQNAVTFKEFSLDDDKEKTTEKINKLYKGKYSVTAGGDYVINIDDNTIAEIYFEANEIDYISVQHSNCSYTKYIDIVKLVIEKHGEPKGSYISDDYYVLYWWAENPVHDVRVVISLSQPYLVNEQVFYGK